ncbi:S9 family peptidase [Marinicrinis lubricantis]
MSIEKDMYVSELVVYDTISGTEKPLLSAEQREEVPADQSPAWSPDGKKLAFMRKAQGKDELWLYEADQHTVRPLVQKYKIKGFVWSPDGSKIAFVSRVNDVNNVAYKVKRIRFKLDGEGMTNGYTHIFLLDVESGNVAQLTTRETDHGNPVFSADATRLYYSSDYPEGSDLDKQPLIYEHKLKTGEEKVLHPELKFISSLFPLPDGSVIGTGKRDISSSTEYDKWFHVDGVTSITTWLNGQPDVHIGTHVIGDSKRTGFSSVAAATEDRSRYVYAATYEGKQSLYVLELHSATGAARDSDNLDAKVMKLPIEHNVISFDVVKCDGQQCIVVFVGDTMDKPGELYRAVWTYGEEIQVDQLTDHHAEFLKHLPPVDIQSYIYEAEDGLRVEGWSMQPSRDRSAKDRRGTMLWIHGGPHLSYGHAFHYDFWYWVSLGYRVVFCNPRGSSGYGQSFAREIIGQWGGKDVTDVLGFLEMVLEKEGRDEEEPLYLLGGSYGGYLVNWIVGHDHRFKAAVTERSICNLYSKVGNSDIGFQNNPHQLGGKDLWTDEEHIMERSPIRYAPKVQTPVLIIHAEQDHRCPIEQAEQWFTALWRLGKDVEFIRFPGASHALATAGRPQQRIARLNGIREWLYAHA